MKRLFGIMDILAGLWLILTFFWAGSAKFAFILGVFLIMKGIVFRGSWVSWIDFGIGIYMILLFMAPSTFLNWIAAIFLLQKGLRSMF